MKRLELIIFVSIISLGILFPLQPLRAYNVISNSDGLSNSSIRYIAEDSDLNLWIGTWDGLNVYNGRGIKIYRYNKNENSICNNIVDQIFEQDSVHMWIATYKGLNRFNRITEKFDHYLEEESDFQIAISKSRDVICNIYDKGIYYFQPITNEFVKIECDIDHKIVKMYIDASNNLYAQHKSGELKKYQIIKEDGVVSIVKDETIKAGHINDFCLFKDLLLIAYDTSFDFIDTKILDTIRINTQKDKRIDNISHNGKIVLIKYSEGDCSTYNLENGNFTHIVTVPKEIRINYIFMGSQNIVWLGTQGQGVISLHRNSGMFKPIKLNASVNTFCEDNNRRILVGTDREGIKILNKETGGFDNPLTKNDGLSSNTIHSIKKNNNGDLFVGTDKSGIDIIYYDNKGEIREIKPLIIPKDFDKFKNVNNIVFTNNDSIVWLGSTTNGVIKIVLEKEGGLYKAKDIDQYRSYEDNSTITSNFILSIIHEKESNVIWIGTLGGGINRLQIDTDKIDRLENLNKNLTSSDILSLHIGSYNNLWIGTSYGLNKFLLPYALNKKEKISKDEITNNTIYGILEDKDNNIWISTNEGIYLYNMITKEITNYNSKDGLHNDEFCIGAYYEDEDNILYFGGVDGFTFFNVNNNVILRDFVPSIKLKKLKINDQIEDVYYRIPKNTLNLDYNEQYITFTFLANELINNQNCEYAYRIVGFAEEWILNSTNPNIILTKMPPGKYTLEVKCSNGDRVWNDSVYSLDIVIANPWWKSDKAKIFYVLLFLIIIFIISVIIKGRIQLKKQVFRNQIESEHQKKLYESRLNFYTNIAHELYTPLTLIYSPAQHLLEDGKLGASEKKHVSLIIHNAEHMMKLISELMEFRKIESGHTSIHPEVLDVSMLSEHFNNLFTELSKEDGRDITFSFDIENLSNFISDRSAIEKIFTNLITNAFKFSPANGFIIAKLWQDETDGNLNFKIRNSGDGLTEQQMVEIFNRYRIFNNTKNTAKRSSGIGLHLTKSLVELMGGQITVDSKLGIYTEFMVVLKPMDLQTTENESNNDSATNKTGIIEPNKDITILIVEDEQDIRDILKEILEPFYSIREAGDGQDALDEIEKNMPDLIICDILMPRIDGFELIDRLKSDKKTNHIPIISVTAKINVEDQIKAFKHGVDLYITKPFNHKHLLTAVESTLSNYKTLKKYFNSSRSGLTVKDGIILHNEDKKFLEDIISFIETNIDKEDLNQDKIAQHIGMSRASLYETLRRLSDKTPSEFIRQIRLEYASKLLLTTQLTVSEIMFKSGFLSKSYFHKEFMKLYNYSPREYRQKTAADSE